MLVLGKNIGTVSDEAGNFKISSTDINDGDSLRFSAIGFESRTLRVRDFKEDTIKHIFLNPRFYNLHEVSVTYNKRKYKEIRLGNPVSSKVLKSGFADNNLGSELGIKLFVRKEFKLKNINLNVAACTYDTVTYRLNIYETFNQITYRNILTEPIYISFSKDKINEVITFDLSKYSITLEGYVMIALELYKELGEGKLLFHTEYFTGSTYHRKTGDGVWAQSPGVIGMYLKGNVIR